MKKITAQRLLILVFSTLLVSCQANAIGFNTPTPTSSPRPTPRPTDPLFPQQPGPDKYDPLHSLAGKLVLVDGCLRLQSTHQGNYLVIWPHGYWFDRGANPMQVYDDTGIVVANLGDYIDIQGDEISSGELSSWVQLPNGCSGPYWLMPSSRPTPVDTHFPLAWPMVLDPATKTLTGKLIEVNGCLRLQVDKKSSFLLIWPDYLFSIDREKEPIQLHGDSYGEQGAIDIVREVGKEITLSGREISLKELGDYTVHPIPNECVGPYWGVVKIK